MDYLDFTKQRTQFLRFFYSEAAAPFVVMRQQIEACEAPFEHPPGHEDSEPPFLNEWEQAGNALDVLGQSVASFLSGTLQLYLKHWVEELRRWAGEEQLAAVGVGVPENPAYRKAFKKGWWKGYQAYCAKLDVNWTDSPVDLDLLDQLVLARNSAQHPTDITSVRARQSEADAVRYPNAYFGDAFDIALNEHMKSGSRFLRSPRLDITPDRLSRALDEVETFCEWLDTRQPMRSPPPHSS